MANLGMNFEADSVEARQSFEPLPAGDYMAEIIDSEMKPTKAGDNEFLKLTFAVTEGEYVNRLYWENLNINHANETPRKIALQTLGEITKACGLKSVDDSDQLHNRPLLMKISLRKRKDDPTRFENTARFEPLNVVSATAAPRAAAPGGGTGGKPAAPPPAVAKKPWEVKKGAA